jgi:hypothetical protein
VQIKSLALVARLTKLHGNMVIPCSRCERNADLLLFDGDKVATASQLMFFCKQDLSKFLQSHPSLFDQLVLEFGTDDLHVMLDTAKP